MSNHILSQNAFWIVNKDLARAIGIESTMLLSDLLSKYDYFKAKDRLVDSEWFFNTSEEIEKETTLSYHKQKKCIEILEEKGFIATKLIGIPAKLHFKIFESEILNFLNPSIRKIPILYNKNIPNKNKKNKGELKNSSTDIIRKAFIKSFSFKYEEIFRAKFTWDGKQIKQLSLLIAKIQKSYKDAGLLNPSTDQQVAAFEIIMDRALNKDNWYRSNFEPAILNSKFNILKVKPNGTTKTAVESLRAKYADEAGLA